MEMADIKKPLIIIIFIVALLIFGMFVFTRILFKENVPLASMTGEEMPGSKESTASLNYTIPSDIVPTTENIDENIKNAEKKRLDSEAVLDEVAAVKAKQITRRKIIQQEAIKKESEKKPEEKTILIPEKKKVVFPTREERERQRSGGVITY